MTARHESDLESRWTYDTAAKGIGQLAEAYTLTGSAKDYSRLHTYDSLGRPSRSSQLINSQVYSQTPDYDLWGRLIRTTYQRGSDSAKVYDTRYNNTGYLARTERGALILWQVTTQDAAQRPTSALLGNGLFDLRSYNVNTGRLDSGTVHSNGTPRLQESYQYDPLGNVTQRAQYWDSGSFNEGFSYDSLNRLSTSQVGGQALQTTSYDPAGNLSSKTGIGSYTYPSQGSSAIRPHAVQSTSSQGSFTYDNNGNLKTGAGRNLTWTSYDMPVQIQRGTITDNFVYGPEHQRVRQDRNDGSSLIYAGAQEIDTKGGTTIKTYWPGGIGVEIDKPGASNSELYWHHKDRLGSPIALSGSDGSLSEKLAYDAWGRRRTLDGSAPLDNSTSHLDNKGYTGHEMLDQVDLVHMNGRIYDPITARFLSGDPLIQDPINGQNYNRYSYVLNNPTNLTDPTGFETVEIIGHRLFDFVGPSVTRVLEQMRNTALQQTMNAQAAGRSVAKSTVRFIVPTAARAFVVLGTVITAGNQFQDNDEDVQIAAINAAAIAAAASNADAGKNASDALKGTTNSATASPPPDGEDKNKGKDKLTQGEQKAVNKIDKIINNFKDHDIEGAIKDMQGNPVSKPGGGTWNHLQEVQDVQRGLTNHAETLKGVNNPEAIAARNNALNLLNRIDTAFRGAGF
ncbi:polymorphic toxin type 28 domain-containing protein [Undibacterium sp. Jales W-56]|uniref:RHS repeat-associated core domain-containing protein n=1 Tax=Undibacterium sp. Jales W-56 TaxID=2897325 RepID=UPI0021CE5878|nr:RHS repeat-associated core domain-containing protein [Undibacterium sp. Jales W-56]MCU6433688.1 polymorphic toxin type 28 domain-containing protein [Undibacterium sp. Jales W-56]